MERQKHKYFLICLAASIPPLLFFGLEDLMAGRHMEAFLTFAQGLLFVCLFVWGILSNSIVFLRAAMLIFAVFLIYLIVGGTGGGYGSLWVYTFPLASFYLLDRREGLVWTVCFYVLMATVLLLPPSEEVKSLETAFVIRLLSTFLIVSIMAYAYATVREKLHKRMQRELEEKNMLLNEIHHRVKNNLTVVQSILSLGLGEASDEASRTAIRDTEARVRSMSLLHETLYSEGESSRVEVSRYLGKVVRHLSDSYGIHAKDAVVLMNIPETWFDVELAMPCGLIVNELLSNVFKYAVPNECGLRAGVSLSPAPEGEYTLSVRDNGAGLPEGFDLSGAKTYGLKIINSFVEQIGGRLEVQSGPEGTEFRMTFRPMSSPEHKNLKNQST